MRKSVSILLCVLLLLTLFTFPVSALPVNAKITIKNSPTAPVTDGVVTPGEHGAKIHSVDYSSDEFLSAYNTDETIDGSIMGKPLTDPAYNISVTAPEEYIPGQTIDVEMTLRDIKAESGYGL